MIPRLQKNEPSPPSKIGEQKTNMMSCLRREKMSTVDLTIDANEPRGNAPGPPALSTTIMSRRGSGRSYFSHLESPAAFQSASNIGRQISLGDCLKSWTSAAG